MSIYSCRRGVVVILTAQLQSIKPELVFCGVSNPACGVSEIRDCEDPWQWPRLEIRQNAFCRSTIPQKQFFFSNAKNSSFGGALPFFEVFSNFAKLNSTFSSERDMKRISRWWIFEALEVDVSANGIVSFKVRFLLGRDLLSVQLFFINSRTI